MTTFNYIATKQPTNMKDSVCVGIGLGCTYYAGAFTFSGASCTAIFFFQMTPSFSCAFGTPTSYNCGPWCWDFCDCQGLVFMKECHWIAGQTYSGSYANSQSQSFTWAYSQPKGYMYCYTVAASTGRFSANAHMYSCLCYNFLGICSHTAVGKITIAPFDCTTCMTGGGSVAYSWVYCRRYALSFTSGCCVIGTTMNGTTVNCLGADKVCVDYDTGFVCWNAATCALVFGTVGTLCKVEVYDYLQADANNNGSSATSGNMCVWHYPIEIKHSDSACCIFKTYDQTTCYCSTPCCISCYSGSVVPYIWTDNICGVFDQTQIIFVDGTKAVNSGTNLKYPINTLNYVWTKHSKLIPSIGPLSVNGWYGMANSQATCSVLWCIFCYCSVDVIPNILPWLVYY